MQQSLKKNRRRKGKKWINAKIKLNVTKQKLSDRVKFILHYLTVDRNEKLVVDRIAVDGSMEAVCSFTILDREHFFW